MVLVAIGSAWLDTVTANGLLQTRACLTCRYLNAGAYRIIACFLESREHSVECWYRSLGSCAVGRGCVSEPPRCQSINVASRRLAGLEGIVCSGSFFYLFHACLCARYRVKFICREHSAENKKKHDMQLGCAMHDVVRLQFRS